MEQKTTKLLPATLVIVLAAYLLILAAHPVLAMWVGGLGMMTGLAGLIRSASPRVGGGLLSTIITILAFLSLWVAGLANIGVIRF